MASKETALWVVLIVEHDGRGQFLGEAGGGGVAVYHSQKRAEEVAEFMRDVLGDDVRNVSVARNTKECAQESLDSIVAGVGPRSDVLSPDL